MTTRTAKETRPALRVQCRADLSRRTLQQHLSHACPAVTGEERGGRLRTTLDEDKALKHDALRRPWTWLAELPTVYLG
jgi:hypothetical protein